MKNILLFFALLSSISTGFTQKKFKKLLLGGWEARLHLTPNDHLPFQLVVSGKPRNYSLHVVNGTDTITLEKGVVLKDSLHFKFPDYHSELIFKCKNKKLITGYWKNYNKGANYKIPFEAKFGYGSRIPWCCVTDSLNIPLVDGKWEVTFDYDTDHPFSSIGNFKQTGDEVTGTFLTETGDFGFLEGNISNDSLYLTGFDGAKAYLFKAKISHDSMQGEFKSGVHFVGQWKANRNDDFELSHPDSLTVLVSDFHFTAHDLLQNEVSFPNEKYRNKVVLVQIMGSWCANCLDETRLFKELYATYHEQGLEIIGVAYELGADMKEWIAKVNRMKDRHKIEYDLLIGGPAKSTEVMNDFPSLNNFYSYPTTIFIDKTGMVRKIRTGFSGPGTGQYYLDYVREINLYLQELLAE